MQFVILYCRPCGYRERAETLATELRSEHGAEVYVEHGKFVQFDVLLDGELVASKGGFWLRKLKHHPPGQPEIIAAIERALADRDGDACDIGDPASRS